MLRRIVYFLLFLLLLADLSYSFMQHINQPLDGDMGWIVVPAEEVKPILESPLGFRAIINNESYANPNRFFCQWGFREYLMQLPLFLQNWKQPIDSVYLACAILKIIVQLLLIILLAVAITGSTNVLKLDFIMAAVLVTPLFQTNGYRSIMGIIDPSATYVFFYALPTALLILYLMPFFFKYYFGKNIAREIIIKILWIPFAFIICLSGPLNPGIVLTVSMLLFLNVFLKNLVLSNTSGVLNKVSKTIITIPNDYWFYLLPVSILSLYSLFLGRYNSITLATQIPLLEMYSRIPEGIFLQTTRKLGFPLLFIMLTLNSILIGRKFKSAEGKKILSIFKWIGIFSLCYILLLPLGGYREYRHYVLRYDTILPITLSLFFVFGISTLYLYKRMKNKQRAWYLPIIFVILFAFTFADEPEFDNNECERSALIEIAGSTQDTVVLHHDCPIVEWGKLETPERSDLNASLFQIWGITKEKKLYYQK